MLTKLMQDGWNAGGDSTIHCKLYKYRVSLDLKREFYEITIRPPYFMSQMSGNDETIHSKNYCIQTYRVDGCWISNNTQVF